MQKAHVPALRPLAHIEEEQLWHAIDGHRKRLESGVEETLDLLTPEWGVLANPEHAPESDDFRLRSTSVPVEFRDQIEQVVLADRLREVVALVGFTRVAPPDEIDSGEGLPRAPVSRQPPHWVPCAEVRGEGVFIRLPEERVASWEQHADGHPQVVRLLEAYRNWRMRWGLDPDEGWPGARYVLLHTLAHVLIREFALECGYGASSIRERLLPATAPEPRARAALHLRSALFRARPVERWFSSRRGLPRMRVRFRDIVRARKPVPRPRGARRDIRGSRARLLLLHELR